MKLHAPDRELFVAHAHDFTLVSFRGDLQAIGQGMAFDHQRVIARCRERIWHALEQILSVVPDRRSFAVHDPVIDHDGCAKGVADALVPEANAERGSRPPEVADDVV